MIAAAFEELNRAVEATTLRLYGRYPHPEAAFVRAVLEAAMEIGTISVNAA